MKAIAVTPAKQQIALIDRPVPEITSPTQVKLRILEVGVCGTDREISRFEYGTPPDGSEQLVIGHESLGQVAAVGSAVKNFAVGDLAMVMVRRPCNHEECLPCRSGRQDFCVTGDYAERGIKSIDGFMTEYVVDEEKYMFKLPAGLRDVGVLTEPLTIAEKAIEQLLTMQHRLPWEIRHKEGDKSAHTCLVLGAGPVGLLGAFVFRAAGFNVFLYSKGGANEERAKIGEAVGAGYISADTVPISQLGKETGGFDVVFEATGASQLSFDVIPQLGINGVFIFTGVPGRKRKDLSIDGNGIMQQLVLKNQIVFGTVNAGRESYESAINRIADIEKRWPGVLSRVITARHKPEEFMQLLTGDATGIKHTIAFGR